jgi:hypothetical protein
MRNTLIYEKEGYISLPGNLTSCASVPDSTSVLTRRSHCVDLPERSQPSTTINNPR